MMRAVLAVLKSPFTLVAVSSAAAAGIALYGIAVSRKRMRSSFFMIALLPNLVMLFLFYSLAIHAHWYLGRWPMHNEEPSSLLSFHSNAASGCCLLLYLLNISVLPVVVLFCSIVIRWRHLLAYLGVYAFSYIASVLVMLHLAPSAFLGWYWD